jgi:hypothetical protein
MPPLIFPNIRQHVHISTLIIFSLVIHYEQHYPFVFKANKTLKELAEWRVQNLSNLA